MHKIKNFLRRMLRAQQEYLSQYRAGHKTIGCRITHMLGIPMIMAAILAFVLYLIPAVEMITVVIQVAFTQSSFAQFVLCLRVFLPLVVPDVLTTPMAMTNLFSGILLFTVGWFLQFIGHMAFEKNSPLFLTNPFNPLSYTTAVIFIAEEFGQLVTRPFKRKR